MRPTARLAGAWPIWRPFSAIARGRRPRADQIVRGGPPRPAGRARGPLRRGRSPRWASHHRGRAHAPRRGPLSQPRRSIEPWPTAFAGQSLRDAVDSVAAALGLPRRARSMPGFCQTRPRPPQRPSHPWARRRRRRMKAERQRGLAPRHGRRRGLALLAAPPPAAIASSPAITAPPAGEIDIIARRGDASWPSSRSRRGRMLTAAAESLLARQRRRIARAAAGYLALRPELQSCRCRFDVILVTPWRWPRHIRDAWHPASIP